MSRRLTQAPLQHGELKNMRSAAPGQGKSGAAVAIVVNDGSAVAKAVAFEANA
jgi:hypothetical protein